MADAGIEASGRLGDPDPVVAVENTINDEQVDEIIVSTFPAATSGWLRRDVLDRIRSFGLPVTHVVVTQEEAESAEETAVA
jgi:GABA permease